VASQKVENRERTTETVEPVNKERREALRRVARYGAYTAPALLTMLASEKAVAADSAR
jgi:hypothetical protein